MTDKIQLLPDAVANQIAAGEVIQRPASVVKELMENAVDAKASTIHVVLKDAGKTLIQVIDDGYGMSETDARLAFERHATSKIRKAEDLFSVESMGFRGEALPSIASIAHLEVKTRMPDQELGTYLEIRGSDVVKQEPMQCPAGTNITVKNLFYNVPARRKFLKKDSTELRHIINQFQRIVLAHPDIAFSLTHNDNPLYNLRSDNLKKRLYNLFGKGTADKLVNVQTDTTIIKIYGYIGKPEAAKKTTGEQFFFVNRRFIRSPYFYKAITKAFEDILPKDVYPTYFLFFETDPSNIDVNIHPTKTEINFENATAVFQILQATVKETLGKFNFAPSIDFDTEGSIDLPPAYKKNEVEPPQIEVNPKFNPFDEEKPESRPPEKDQRDNLENWQQLYQHFEQEAGSGDNSQGGGFVSSDKQEEARDTNFFQFKQKYILTTVKSGLLIVDQRRAHIRILFERFLQALESQNATSQRSLFPETIELQASDTEAMKEILPQLNKIGFEISEFGKNAFIVNAVPSIMPQYQTKEMLMRLIEYYKATAQNVEVDFQERVAASLARAAAISGSKVLSEQEMRDFIDQLFACAAPNYTPEGKKTVHIFKLDDLNRFFN